jgi:hypothetical protein
MKKYFVGLSLILFCLMSFGFGQKTDEVKYRKITEMIEYSQKTNGMLSDLLGGMGMPNNSETTILTAINFPNQVKVKYSDDIQKMSKPRKKIADQWLKEYAAQPSMRPFYINEIQVEEDNVKYWIMAHENMVVSKLKNSAQKNSEIILNLKILGYRKKGQSIEYFLLADGVQ